jgi:hypothetical protein
MRCYAVPQRRMTSTLRYPRVVGDHRDDSAGGTLKFSINGIADDELAGSEAHICFGVSRGLRRCTAARGGPDHPEGPPEFQLTWEHDGTGA